MTKAINIALPLPASWQIEARRLASMAPQPNAVPLAAGVAIAHITLAMGVVDEAALPNLQVALREVANSTQPFALTPGYIYVKRDLGRRDFSGVQIRPSSDLRALHEAALEALLAAGWQRPALGSFAGFPDVDADTLDLVTAFRESGTYDNYFPHITLAEGALHDGSAFFKAKPGMCTEITLFAMGSLCTCREVIEMYSL